MSASLRLYLINPCNPLVSITKVEANRWNQYRVWKPLGLLVVAGLTPAEWDITVIDENLESPDYDALPGPDLVGITAFTSQAARAYEVAALFRARGVPVVMGGIHATMCAEEALERVDAVVEGEAESTWRHVLADARRGELRRRYSGRLVELEQVPIARHDLLPRGYFYGSLQTTRGCPLSCTFCSVTSFNGRRYRHRPIADVIEELRAIPEKHVLVVDDNLIGTRKDHIARSKALFQAIIDAKLNKRWICQATINMGDDDELLRLAAKSGCYGVLVGFESPSAEGLQEIGKKFNLRQGRDLAASVRNIQRHGIMVVGAFIMGLDADRPGVGTQIAEAGLGYGVDVLNVLILTPLPGTAFYQRMLEDGRIVAKDYPQDWRYYTLNHPVMSYQHLSWGGLVDEMEACYRSFYSYPRIARRLVSSLWRTGRALGPLVVLATNLSYRHNLRWDLEKYRQLDLRQGRALLGAAP